MIIIWFFFAIPWIIKDMFKRDKKASFNDYARIDIFTGKTGSGKSISAVRYVKRMKRRFPDAKVYSNITSPIFDGPLSKGLVTSYADSFPQIVVIDEANTTFPAKLKGNVDDQLRHFLTQTRKGYGRYIILLTQDYSMLDTNYRKLAHYVFQTKTYFKRLSTFRRFRQEDFETYSQAGGVNTFSGTGRKAPRKSDFYIQTDALRNLYDYKEKVNTDWFIEPRQDPPEALKVASSSIQTDPAFGCDA